MSERAGGAYNTKPEVLCVGDDAPRACRHRHRRYGMSCAEYASLFRRADGKCEICRIPGSKTKHGYLVIDHDYAYGFNGGAVRGLLCSTCNTRIAYPLRPSDKDAAERYLANPWHLQRRDATVDEQQEVRRAISESPQRSIRSTCQQRVSGDLSAVPTNDELAAIRTRYDAAIAAAKAERAAGFLAAIKTGRTMNDIAEATGYTRETVRRIANPEAAEAIRNARRTKKEQSA
jgi:hypothetical protein